MKHKQYEVGLKLLTLLLTEVDGVPPEGARTITLLSIGDDDVLSEEKAVG